MEKNNLKYLGYMKPQDVQFKNIPTGKFQIYGRVKSEPNRVHENFEVLGFNPGYWRDHFNRVTYYTIDFMGVDDVLLVEKVDETTAVFKSGEYGTIKIRIEPDTTMTIWSA